MPTLTLDFSYRSPAFPAGVATVGIWLAWAAVEGGFDPTIWGFVGIGLVVLLAMTAIVTPPRVGEWGRARTVMLGALAAFVAWNYLSILWADFPADAWAGADKTLVIAASFAALIAPAEAAAAQQAAFAIPMAAFAVGFCIALTVVAVTLAVYLLLGRRAV